MTEEKLFNKVKSLKKENLPYVYCYFNNFEFPEELLDYKPKNWELLTIQIKHEFLTRSFKYIRNTIPDKKLSREWNKNKFNFEEFETWWEEVGCKPLTDIMKKILKILYVNENKNLN